MNGYNFTEGVRQSLAMAREEAARLHHEYVGTEHILLGMLRRDDAVAIKVLEELGVDTSRLAKTIEETVRQGKASDATGPDLPYTSRAKVVLELAMKEARELQHSYVGSEHLLLGLLREEKGIAAQTLTAVGLTTDAVRAETIKLVEGPKESKRGKSSRPTRRVEGYVPVSIVVELRYDEGWTRRQEFRTIEAAMSFLDRS